MLLSTWSLCWLQLSLNLSSQTWKRFAYLKVWGFFSHTIWKLPLFPTNPTLVLSRWNLNIKHSQASCHLTLFRLFQWSFGKADVWSLRYDTAHFPRYSLSLYAFASCPLRWYFGCCWNCWDRGVLLLQWCWQALSKSPVPPEKCWLLEISRLLSFCVPPQMFFGLFCFPAEEQDVFVLNCGPNPSSCEPDIAGSYHREY